MEVSQLFTVIREDYLDDVVEPYKWGSTFLLRSLNRAQEEACMRQKLLVDEDVTAISEVTLVAATSEYTLDSRIVLPQQIRLGTEVLTKTTAEILDRDMPGWRSESGTPSKYIQQGANGQKIRLSPTPAASDDGTTLVINAWRLPESELVDDQDVPEIASQHHRDLIWFVLSEAYGLPDEDTFSETQRDRYMAKFNAVFGEPMRADVLAHRRRHTETSVIRPGHAYQDFSQQGLSGRDDSNWETE